MTFAETECWQQAEVSDRAWILVPAGMINRTLFNIYIHTFSLKRTQNFNHGRWKCCLSRELLHWCALRLVFV